MLWVRVEVVAVWKIEEIDTGTMVGSVGKNGEIDAGVVVDSVGKDGEPTTIIQKTIWIQIDVESLK